MQEYLRLGVKRRGCNGLAYTLNYSGADTLFENTMSSTSKIGVLSNIGLAPRLGRCGKNPWQPARQNNCLCADSKGKFDEVVEEQGVRVLIDPGALMHVVGTKMDFVEDRLK